MSLNVKSSHLFNKIKKSLSDEEEIGVALYDIK